MNRFSMIGRLIKDPELRYNKDNLAISEPTIATNEKESQFIRVKIYGKQAENLNKYCKKGTLLAVSGTIKNNNYEDKEGNKHYEYSFIAQTVEFLSTQGKGEFTMEFEKYGRVPNAIAEELIKKYQDQKKAAK